MAEENTATPTVPVDTESQVVAAGGEEREAAQGPSRRRCGHEVDIDSLAAPRHVGGLVQCKPCQALQKLLQRNVGEIPQLSDADMGDFYRKCLAMKMSDGEPLTWKRVRGTLIQSLTKAETSTTEEENGGEYLPLSVYEARGYNTEDIELKAPKRECPVMGSVFCVPVFKVAEKRTWSQCEEVVNRLEREVKRKKVPALPPVPKGKAKAKAGAQPPPPQELTPVQQQLKEDIEQHYVDLLSDSEDEAGILKFLLKCAPQGAVNAHSSR